MSRVAAGIFSGALSFITIPLGRKRRDRTLARVRARIDRDGIRQVSTSKGALSFYAVRGVNTEGYVRRFGRDEPETLEWIDSSIKPGETLWDIGANIGLYSLYASQTANVTVYAFEPSALNFGLLTENIMLNKAGDHVKPFCIALSDKTALDNLHIRDFEIGHACNAAGNAETQFSGFTPEFSQAIPVMRMDDFCRVFDCPPPDHIKLDVDGAEGAILNGGPETLKSVKSVIIEVEGRNAEEAATRIEQPLEQAGLREDESWRDKGSRRNRVYRRRGV